MTLFLLTPFFVNTPAHAAVVINEILPIYGDPRDPSMEWIELYSTDPGPDPKSLNGWILQNAAGDKFHIGASPTISPHGFLTFTASQMNLSFSIHGDTVQLFDEKSTLIDSQSYPGILGYGNSMGRSVDGSGTWTTCTTATFNTNNNCPQPSPTPTTTSYPTATPTPKPIATATPTPAGQSPLGGATPTLTPAPAQQTFGSFLPSPTTTQVLGAVDLTSPTPTPDSTRLTLKIDKILAYQI